MAAERGDITERTQLLSRTSDTRQSIDVESIISAHVKKDELALAETAVGERLPYNDYTTIDWLHDLVKDSYRFRSLRAQRGWKRRLYAKFDSCQGWIAAALIGMLTACVASVVDLSVATVSDWKTGFCRGSLLASREWCCTRKSPFITAAEDPASTCSAWQPWTENYWAGFAIYVGWALLFGLIAGAATMTTKSNLPAAAPGQDVNHMSGGANGDANNHAEDLPTVATGKVMYMAAGSGIPEIKTILSGFVIPHFLDLKVLLVKAVGSIFAVSTGMNLGKEGPFVHISTCMAYLVATWFPKYRDNGRKMREMLSAGCAAGLSVAFGAPIGGVLFAYEEISTHFPRKVLWRSFICSLFAAIVLREINPTGTGKLVLFETNYGTTYEPYHYLVFLILGVAGGVFGGIFCKANFLWSRTFRKYSIIKNHPVFEVFLIVLATALLQYPNPLTREPGDIVIKNLLVDCSGATKDSFVCRNEVTSNKSFLRYLGWLTYGTLVKLVLTIITFGIKVPLGVIIPALDGGAFFGRLVGQTSFLARSISPGIFAMVGAGAFLAGVSRMTISLAVIMFELTGELEFIVPNMIGIMVAKWVADAIESEGVYDLAQTVLGHPFLDMDSSINDVRQQQHLACELIPPKQTMDEIMVELGPSGTVSKHVLASKLELLKRRGLMDAGLVLVHAHLGNTLAGYISESEIEFGLYTLGADYTGLTQIRLLHRSLIPRHRVSLADGQIASGEELDLSSFVDQTPLTISEMSPMEYVVEMFGKLGLRHLIITAHSDNRVLGVVIKKRLVAWLEALKHNQDGD